MTETTLPQQFLAAYAGGTASPAVSLLVASHLTHSPESRRRVARLEAMGGALMGDAPGVALSPDALDRALERLDEPDDGARRDAPVDAGPLPRPLAEALGIAFEAIPWRFRLPGIAEYDLPGFDDEEHVSLLRAKPGARVPQHTHEGMEMTLVLAGALEDGGIVYGPGDVAINTDTDDHKPTIAGDEVCYCLIVMDGRMKFTGPFSRMLNLFGD